MGHFTFCMQSFQRESIFAQSTAPPPPHPQEPEQGINQNGDHVLMSTCSACVSMYVILYHTILIGVWLGDPRSHHSEGKKVWTEGAHPERVSAAVSVSYDAEKLALNLLSALFTLTELATGNCTQPKKDCYHLLDQKKIHGIRRMYIHHTNCMSSLVHLLLSFPSSVPVNYKFPLPLTEEGARWKTIVKDKLNVKCRGFRPKAEQQAK